MQYETSVNSEGASLRRGSAKSLFKQKGGKVKVRRFLFPGC